MPEPVKTLADHEAVVEIGLGLFLEALAQSEVGDALVAIRDQRLYEPTHATFDAYLVALAARWIYGDRRPRLTVVQGDQYIKEGSARE